jgi:fibronectin type III domain protein/calcineurin-like phosphoesterase family protein
VFRLGLSAGLLLALAAALPQLRGASASGDPVIATAGDIACDPASSSYNGGNGTSSACRQKYTSDLLVNGGFTAVLPLGDNQYYCGSLTAFNSAYDPSWGRVKGITDPTTGNHEYLTSGGSGGSTGCDSSNNNAAGYFNYFGAAAGDPTKGYYSFDIGSDWHLIALNSQCSHAGGCGTGTAQYTWLQNDLAAHAGECILAYWHIPLFSSGGRAAANTKPFWNLLYNAHADINLTGHDHIYERFAPQDPNGNLDSANGIREFIVGTGGANHTSIVSIAPNSVVHDNTTFGVLELTLHQGSYNWQFVRAAGNGTFTDSGSAACHANSGADTIPPSVPAGLAATPAGTSEIDLSWTASTDNPGGSGVAGYRIYRSDHGSTPLATVTGTSYADLGLLPATTYTYTVSAFDQAGNESAQSQPVSATTLSSGGGTGTQTLNPIADSWVNSAAPTTNYGSSTSLYVDGDGVRYSYLKFDLSGVGGTVTGATLQIYAGSSQATGYQVYSVADTSWSESALTWNTKPPMGSTSSGSSGPVTTGTWTSVTLPSSLVQAALGGKLSLGLQTTSNTNLKLLSRESTTQPKLVVTSS